MKRLLINLTDEEHEALRKEAFESDMSMSELLKGNYFSYNPLNIESITLKTKKETFKVPSKFKVCKHGAAIGLCKYGCKK